MPDTINTDEAPYTEPTSEAFELLYSRGQRMESIAVDEEPGLNFPQLSKMCKDVRRGYKQFMADRGIKERHRMRDTITSSARAAVAEREIKRKQNFRAAVAARRKK
jgi:hypothetical protein